SNQWHARHSRFSDKNTVLTESEYRKSKSRGGAGVGLNFCETGYRAIGASGCCGAERTTSAQCERLTFYGSADWGTGCGAIDDLLARVVRCQNIERSVVIQVKIRNGDE